MIKMNLSKLSSSVFAILVLLASHTFAQGDILQSANNQISRIQMNIFRSSSILALISFVIGLLLRLAGKNNKALRIAGNLLMIIFAFGWLSVNGLVLLFKSF